MADKFARWISVFFDSSFLSLPIFLGLGYVSGSQPSSFTHLGGILWAFLLYLVVTGIPLTYLLIGKKLGWVSDLELTRREERPRFILVSLSSDILALILLWIGNGPHLLWLIILTYFCLAMVMFSISSFWKISMHMAGVGGFSTALVFVFGAAAAWAFLSLPLVAWARLRRRKHTPAQLIAGAMVGCAVTYIVFRYL
ncbi:MAG: hypothetical protein ACPL4H_09075 [Anaerolineales bacterium]